MKVVISSLITQIRRFFLLLMTWWLMINRPLVGQWTSLFLAPNGWNRSFFLSFFGWCLTHFFYYGFHSPRKEGVQLLVFSPALFRWGFKISIASHFFPPFLKFLLFVLSVQSLALFFRRVRTSLLFTFSFYTIIIIK